MKTYSLSEISKATGVSEVVLRQHVSRGQLRADKAGGRLMVAQADLDAYLATREVSSTAKALKAPSADVPREIGNMFARLPSSVVEAILGGMPTAKKAGSGDAFRKLSEQLPHQPVPEASGDPHWGFAIGYQHREAPRWKRVSDSTWSLDGVSWRWDGYEWVGSKPDATLGMGISPASPWSDQRPLAPARKVEK